MDSTPRGRAIIIVTQSELANEAEQFKSIFTQLLFETEVYSLITCDEIQIKLTQLANTNEYNGNAFIMMFIGNGYNENIIGYREPNDTQWPPENHNLLPISDIVATFAWTRAPVLRDKIKVFIFNCDRLRYGSWCNLVGGPIGYVTHFGQTFSHTIAQYSSYKSLIEMFVMTLNRMEDELTERRLWQLPEINMFETTKDF
ncbi:unnamed protein product, partial [Medioppia subpectinata]